MSLQSLLFISLKLRCVISFFCFPGLCPSGVYRLFSDTGESMAQFVSAIGQLLFLYELEPHICLVDFYFDTGHLGMRIIGGEKCRKNQEKKNVFSFEPADQSGHIVCF